MTKDEAKAFYEADRLRTLDELVEASGDPNSRELFSEVRRDALTLECFGESPRYSTEAERDDMLAQNEREYIQALEAATVDFQAGLTRAAKDVDDMPTGPNVVKIHTAPRIQ
jgi:hypothetical protein